MCVLVVFVEEWFLQTLHFFVGPHATDTEEVYNWIKLQSETLQERHNLFPIFDPVIEKISIFFQAEKYKKAEEYLKKLEETCHIIPGDCLIFCEGFCGDFWSKKDKEHAYPKMIKNLSIVRKAFYGFRCKFYIFNRSPDFWMGSFFPNAGQRGLSKAFLKDTEFLDKIDILWYRTLTKLHKELGLDLVEIQYEEGESFLPATALLQAILGVEVLLQLEPETRDEKLTPKMFFAKVFGERNQTGASTWAQQLAKSWVLDHHTLRNTNLEKKIFNGAERVEKPEWLAPQLEFLWQRIEQRLEHQVQPNFLPDANCDLAVYRTRLVESSDNYPAGKRWIMEDQISLLKYHFRGQPETCLLLGLCISYLRRTTEHREHAALLFHRLWNEEYPILLAVLRTRWLISTFQTFFDHGANETQRQIGSAAYFFSNILKAYESERALDGLPSDKIYKSSKPTTRSGFPGLDRFKLGETDLLLNTNALLLELAVQDDAVGRVVQEFMLRVKRHDTIFSRMDENRIEYSIDIPEFSNCWSFFVDPRINEF